jgi:predicted enzyme related to lactoylglutathione lyase
MANHPIVHIEVVSKDPHATGDFYKEVFGWKIDVDEKFDYVQFSAEPGPGGGFPPADAQQNIKPGDVLLYIDTDDIEATLARIEACGGKTLAPKSEIPGIGWFAIFSDNNGNRLALYTSMRPQG